MIEPIGHRVLLKMQELAKKTKGGIILPDETRYRLEMAEMYGEIVAMGDEAFITHKTKPKVGDVIMIPRNGGLLYTYEAVEYRIIDDIHIQGIIR